MEDGGMVENGMLERMWKKGVMYCYTALSSKLGLEGTMGSLPVEHSQGLDSGTLQRYEYSSAL
jgi:hypothetical protein